MVKIDKSLGTVVELLSEPSNWLIKIKILQKLVKQLFFLVVER